MVVVEELEVFELLTEVLVVEVLQNHKSHYNLEHIQ